MSSPYPRHRKIEEKIQRIIPIPPKALYSPVNKLNWYEDDYAVANLIREKVCTRNLYDDTPYSH